VSAEVDGSATPIRVLVGEHDATNNEAAARATTLTWYPGASLVVLSGVGHYPMIEAPAATISELETFLASVEPVTRASA
jgi:pimeloyl-ACP methyl ester carboxylesterase